MGILLCPLTSALVHEVGYLIQVVSRKALTQNGDVIAVSMVLIRERGG